MLTILYFAKLRDDIDCHQESLEWQPELQSINDIVTRLKARGPIWEKAFNSAIVSSRNQTIAPLHTMIEDGDEIAFFPPVTGG